MYDTHVRDRQLYSASPVGMDISPQREERALEEKIVDRTVSMVALERNWETRADIQPQPSRRRTKSGSSGLHLDLESVRNVSTHDHRIDRHQHRAHSDRAREERNQQLPSVRDVLRLQELQLEKAQDELVALRRQKDKLVAQNRKLSENLLDTCHDSPSSHKTPDIEIEREYKKLQSTIAQTARKLCELRGYHDEAIQDIVDRQLKSGKGNESTETQEIYHNACSILRQKYQVKHMQRYTMEMLLFRRLEQLVIPPKGFYVGMGSEENKHASILLKSVVDRVLEVEPLDPSEFFATLLSKFNCS